MTEFEEAQKDRRELIESRKLKQSTPDGGAGMIKEEYVPIVPKTFKEKWDNYWYHYLGITVGIAAAVVLVTMLVCSLIFKTVYDASITSVTEFPLDALTSQIMPVLQSDDLIDDRTGNGKLELELLPIQLDLKGTYQLDPQMVQGNIIKLTGHIAAMDGYIYLVDDMSYDYLMDMDMLFMDLSDMVDKSHLPKGNDRYSLKGTKLAKELDLGDIGDGLYLCFFDYHSMDAKRQQKKEIKRGYERDLPYFKNLLEYE